MNISDASQLIPINKAGDFIPGRPSRASVWRWVKKGVRGHRLASFVVGSRRYVTPESIAEWLAAINESCSDAPQVAAKQRSQRAKNAMTALQQRIRAQK